MVGSHLIAIDLPAGHVLPMNVETSPYLVAPEPADTRLTTRVSGRDQEGRPVELAVVNERPLTIYLNRQEIVTVMTIGDRPDELAVGYLLNQNMLRSDDRLTGIEFDEDLEVVVVRTERATNYEAKLKKKIRTSGCAVGTVFGDLMEKIEGITLPETEVRTSWLYALSKRINTTPSLYLEAGAIHGCVLCQGDRPLVYMEDVGRHNAVDKIAGWMFLNGVPSHDKLFYTTGRLTSEMVIKTVQMGIPGLVSRSGFTAWGVDLARQTGLTLIGRMKGKRFIVLAGEHRLVWDADMARVDDEDSRSRRKAGAMDDS
ncbi:formate dehydrogenase accessory protein FdhD [alpha proteobacterium BAL199]|nr:formate dehydrogenase accessory protein FdhD [alpha proteobacterium BAL199]